MNPIKRFWYEWNLSRWRIRWFEAQGRIVDLERGSESVAMHLASLERLQADSAISIFKGKLDSTSTGTKP